MTLSQPASGNSSIDAPQEAPALLTSTSSRDSRSDSPRASASMPSMSETSAGMAMHVPPYSSARRAAVAVADVDLARADVDLGAVRQEAGRDHLADAAGPTGHEHHLPPHGEEVVGRQAVHSDPPRSSGRGAGSASWPRAREVSVMPAPTSECASNPTRGPPGSAFEELIGERRRGAGEPPVDERVPQRALADRPQLDQHGRVPVEVRDGEEPRESAARTASFSPRSSTVTARIGPSGGVSSPNRLMSALLNGRSQANTLPVDRPRAVAVALPLDHLGQLDRDPGRLVEGRPSWCALSCRPRRRGRGRGRGRGW